MKLTTLTFCFVLVLVFLSGNVCADQIKVQLYPDTTQAVSLNSEGIAQFRNGESQHLSQPGEPDIPFQVVRVLLPPGADTTKVNVAIASMKTEIVEQECEIRPMPPMAIWDGSNVITVWPKDAPIVNGRNTTIYGSDTLFPDSLVKNFSTGQMRKWKLVEIPVALYQYNPVQKTLYRLVEMKLSIEFSAKVFDSPASLNFFDNFGEEQVRKLAINYENLAPLYSAKADAMAEATGQGQYTVITTNNIESNSTQLANFVINKESLGFTVKVVTEDSWGGGYGDTAAENIRAWLIANAASLNIEYVLLIGNSDPRIGDVPMKMLWPLINEPRDYPAVPSDYYYSDLTGDWDLDNDGFFGEWRDDFGFGGIDRNWDVLVGRIPFYGDFSDLDSILAKLIDYTNEEDHSWRKNVLLPMPPADERTPGYHLGEAIKGDIVAPKFGWNYHRVYNEEYDLMPPPETIPCTVNNVTKAWKSAPFGAIFWSTHGSQVEASGVMDLKHAAKLNNNFPGFVFQHSCMTAWPENPNNLAYSLLLNGAINTVGATRVSFYIPGQTYFTSGSSIIYEYAQRLIERGMNSGKALFDLKQTIYQNGSPWWSDWTAFNIYGDPSQFLLSCMDEETCDDSQFCNGVEVCLDGGCFAGVPSCVAGEHCDELEELCVECSLGKSLDAQELTWNTGGDAEWFCQSDMFYFAGSAAQSGQMTNKQEAWMETTVTGPARFSFYWKVSSDPHYESDPEKDHLEFYINGTEQDRIGGEVEWHKMEYSLPSGTHTLKWQYIKDNGSLHGYNGPDCGWVDKIVVLLPCDDNTDCVDGTCVDKLCVVDGQCPKIEALDDDGNCLLSKDELKAAKTFYENKYKDLKDALKVSQGEDKAFLKSQKDLLSKEELKALKDAQKIRHKQEKTDLKESQSTDKAFLESLKEYAE